MSACKSSGDVTKGQQDKKPEIDSQMLLNSSKVVPPNPKDPFPARLHRMLNDIDALSSSGDTALTTLKEHVSWLDHGKSFRIHNRKKFEELIMPVWFQRLKCNSFLRQLSLYGFLKNHQHGDEKGAWYHTHFQRDQPDLALRIQRMGKRKATRSPAPLAAEICAQGWQESTANLADQSRLDQLLASDSRRFCVQGWQESTASLEEQPQLGQLLETDSHPVLAAMHDERASHCESGLSTNAHIAARFQSGSTTDLPLLQRSQGPLDHVVVGSGRMEDLSAPFSAGCKGIDLELTTPLGEHWAIQQSEQSANALLQYFSVEEEKPKSSMILQEASHSDTAALSAPRHIFSLSFDEQRANQMVLQAPSHYLDIEPLRVFKTTADAPSAPIPEVEKRSHKKGIQHEDYHSPLPR